MTLGIIATLTFLSVLGMSVSTLYFLVEAPAAKRKMRTRLATAQQLFAGTPVDSETLLLNDDLLSEIPTLNRILMRIRWVQRVQAMLTQAAMDMRVDRFLFISLVFGLVGLFIGALVRYPLAGTIILGGLSGAIPTAYVAFKRKQRFSRFEELFPDAIDLLARAVRAGHAFTSGFELIAKEMPKPISDEFQITYEQQNLGMPLREALDNMGRRVPMPDVWFFISALQIQRETGGNLAEILDKLSYVIRERFKILRQVRIHTAEARVSLYILTAIPPVTAILLYVVNREYMMTLVREPLGHIIILTAIVLQIVGYLVMRKITELEV
ncbi:MAG TPA: type II secretion system F family protein [Vicinamibacteria bacterium]|nr:type II secretion system F family protein [Vicinamibacteria bacterium]